MWQLTLGVDLVPIKPIPRCLTFAEDINSFKCRDQLREHLKDWRADVVLHDGAPNVGTAWIQDAYAQSELTLQALKLAVEFLAPGGTFVTKVFRSKDYNNLVWVFNQLFHHVEATKPPSSRNVSAEIFVVCQRFKNLTRIDPKFLDPKYVFKELDPMGVSKEMTGTSSHNLLENVVNPEKARRKREGYEEGNYTLFKTVSADDYIRGPDAIATLGTYNRITFDSDQDKEILNDPLTTEDVKANCEDLKLLGRGDFSVLIKWRKALREKLGIDRSKKQQRDDEAATQTIEVEPLNEEEAIDEELLRLNEESSKRARKERRKRNAARTKALQKLQLNMTTPMELGEDWHDDALHGGTETFSLGAVEGEGHERGQQRRVNELLDADDAASIEDSVAEGSADEESDDDEDERERRVRELEAGMDSMYEQYQQHLQDRDAKFRAKEARRKSSKYEEWGGIGSDKQGDDSDADSEAAGGSGYDALNRRKFAEETYDSDDAEDDDDEREEETQDPSPMRDTTVRSRTSKASSSKHQPLLTSLESVPDLKERQSAESAMWYDNPVFKDMIPIEDLVPTRANKERDSTPELEEDMDEEEDDEEEAEEGAEEDGEIEVVPSSFTADVPEGEWNVYDEDQDAAKREKIAKQGLNTAEAVSMAQALVNRQMTKSDLVDQGFTKHNFNDKSGLPEWFLNDEKEHYRSNIPVTKEAVNALRAKQRALDARPIKKIAEAKARKKHRAATRLENAQKRAEAINENADLTEREKAENINKIMARSMAKRAGGERKPPQLVVARGVNRGVKGRPKGTKGRYRMVDPRMKKELRAQKRKDQREGKKRSSGHKQRRIPKGY